MITQMPFLKERLEALPLSKVKEYIPKIKKAGYKGIIDAAATHIILRQDTLASIPRTATTLQGIVVEEVRREIEAFVQHRHPVIGAGLRTATQEIFAREPQEDLPIQTNVFPSYISTEDLMESEIKPVA